MRNTAFFHKLHKRISALTLAVVMGASVMAVPVNSKALEAKVDVAVEDETGIMEVTSVEVSRFAALKGYIKYQLSQQTSSDEDSVVTVNDRNWQLYRTTYVFDQMNAEEKALYNELENVCNDFVKNCETDAIYLTDRSGKGAYYLPAVSVKDFDGNDYVKVLQLFIYSNPQYYFTTSSFAKSGNNVYLYCYPLFADGEERAVVTNELFSKIDSWVGDIKERYETNVDLEKYTHDFLCDKLSYDYDAADSMNEGDYSGDVFYCQSIYSAVNRYKTVCAGYSLTYELLMNAVGVDTVTAFSDYHAWNKVNLYDDKWYAVDVTWDDYGDASKIDYTFFNKSDEEIQKYDDDLPVHVAKTPEYYPIAQSNYEPEETSDSEQDVDDLIDNNDDVIDSYDDENADAPDDEADKALQDEGTSEINDIVGNEIPSEDEVKEEDNAPDTVISDDTTVISDDDSLDEPAANDVGYVDSKDVTDDSKSTDTEVPNTETLDDGSVEDIITDIESENMQKIQTDMSGDDISGSEVGDTSTTDLGIADVYDGKIAASKITGIKRDRKKIRVTWKKVKNIDGYEIQLSKTRKFKKIARTVKASGSVTKIWVKKLKRNTSYYVRIRTFKEINGEKTVSDWSGVKKVTTK